MTGALPPLEDELTLLVDAVTEGGAAALARFGTEQKVWRKTPHHPVCEADHEVDAILRERLTGARPDYGWLSEETADDGSRLHAERSWVVDPIDGTNSYLNGIAEFAVSAALVEAGQPVAAAVFNPANDEFFAAARGTGATVNGAPIHVTGALDGRPLSILSSRSEHREAGWPERFADSTVDVVSSIAYKFALVAAGRYDAAASVWPKSDWDICAGHLLVEEAGGQVSSLAGEPLVYNRETPRHRTCAATNRAVHTMILDRLGDFHTS